MTPHGKTDFIFKFFCLWFKVRHSIDFKIKNVSLGLYAYASVFKYKTVRVSIEQCKFIVSNTTSTDIVKKVAYPCYVAPDLSPAECLGSCSAAS